MGLILKRESNSNKYKKSDGRAGEQKARTGTSQKVKYWNKDKPKGERQGFKKEGGLTGKSDQKANPKKITKNSTKRSPSKYGKSNTRFR